MYVRDLVVGKVYIYNDVTKRGRRRRTKFDRYVIYQGRTGSGLSHTFYGQAWSKQSPEPNATYLLSSHEITSRIFDVVKELLQLKYGGKV